MRALALLGLLFIGGTAHAQSADAGATLFKQKCSACHSVDPAKPNPIGPALLGVYGRKAGTLAGYNYSPGLKAYGAIWKDDKLDAWLARPADVVAGTKMTMLVPDAQQRKDVIAFLKTAK